MRQALLFVVLHLAGIALVLAGGVRARRHLVLVTALGFPVGLAAVVLACTALTAIGLPFGRAMVAAVLVALGAVAAGAIRRAGGVPRAELRTLAALAVGVALIAAAVSAVDVAFLTSDSFLIATLGDVLARGGGFDEGFFFQLGTRGVFQVVAHALGALLGLDFLYALAPMLGAALLAVFAAGLARGLARVGGDDPRRAARIALATVALATVPLLSYHFVYLHENLGSALYLLVFVVALWLAEVDDAPGLVPIGFLALTAFAFQRIENPLAAVLLGALAILPSGLPRRTLAPWLTGFAVVVAAWNLALAVRLPESDAMKLTTARGLLLATAPAGFAAYWWLARGRWARWHRHVGVVAAALVAAAIAVGFVARPDVALATATVMAANLASPAEWGVAWVVLAALALAGRFAAPAAGRPALDAGPWLYLGFVFVVGLGQGGYVRAWTDSSMRMALHVLPLAAFAAGLRLTAAGSRAPR